jgi:FkbM family methyltransferase
LTQAGTKLFESSAQNFEDVVLWRVLKDVEAGCYVDVGAFDPVVDSISWPFYEQGWQGIAIEPVPAHAAALRERRPRDVTIEAAAGAGRGTATLFVAGSTANSTLDRAVADRIAASSVEFSEIRVRVAPLDDLLADAGLDDRTIHFCTIDVEGREADVLAGFDLPRWRPWILVIEATEPNSPWPSHESWEDGVLAAGYRFCLFDGLNRFYVHADKANEFAEKLSYPACVFDEPFYRAVSAARRVGELERTVSELERMVSELERAASEASRRATESERVAVQAIRRAEELEELAARVPRLVRENAALAARANEAAAELAAMQDTISWRLTRPLRAVRELQLGATRRRSDGTPSPLQGRLPNVDETLEPAFVRRVVQATKTLLPDAELGSEAELHEALDAYEAALATAAEPDRAKAWLSLVVVDGAFPSEESVERVARILRMDGAGRVRKELHRRFEHGVALGTVTRGELDVRRDQVLVDVTHTAAASDLHTGIQRVVRETVARWIETGRSMDLIRFDLHPPAARLLSSEDRRRFESWRSYVGSVPTGARRGEDLAAESTLVPWHCDLVVPELPFEAERTEAYRGLGTASILRSLSMVGYDVIPIVAAEKVVPQVTTDFGGYLSVVKHADRISTISRTSRDSFKAFATMASAEGLRPPVVEALELPAEAPRLDAASVSATRPELGLGAEELVVVVGSHEPRKNHLAVLEAAERLWSSGRSFQLLFLGWSGWLSDEFDDLVDRLVSAGRPITVRKRCSEEQLWAAYRLARFTVFPSLLEGFGLPIAESLASGTPVITSNYGSMAEVAVKGGCLLVNPRDVGELERAIGLLLDDDAALERLRDEASSVDTGTWQTYADDLWAFFAEQPAEAKFEGAA